MSIARTLNFFVPTIICDGCKDTIANALKESALGIKTVLVDMMHEQKKVTIEISADKKNVSDQVILEEVKKILAEFNHSMHTDQEAAALQQASLTRQHMVKGVLGLVGGFGLMMVSMIGLLLPASAMMAVATAASLLSVYLGKESFISAIKTFYHTRRFTMDSLFTISSLAAIGISIAALFVPMLPMMFDAALLVFGFRHIGKAIEESAKTKVVSGVRFIDRAPNMVTVVDNKGKGKEIKRESVSANQIIRVKKGEIIPLDGSYLSCPEGKPTYFDTIMTGSKVAKSLANNTALKAGMYVGNEVDYIDIKVNGSNYLQALDNMMANAEKKKAMIESAADKALQYFVPAVLALASIAGVVIGLMMSPMLALQTAIAILVAACPCVLGFITPLIIKLGVTKAAEHGAVIKDGMSLEALSQVDTFAFDLNGTLTQGEPEVVGCVNSNISPNDWGAVLAIEQQSQHPVALAVCDYITDTLKINNAKTVSNIDATHHAGMAATVDNATYLIGNEDLLKEKGIGIPANMKQVKVGLSDHRVYVVRNLTVIASLQIEDPLRVDAKQVIADLQRKKKKVYIVTGSDEVAALYYAKQLNIPNDHVYASCQNTPKGGEDDGEEDKKAVYIKQLQGNHFVVAMVGDAANDAVAFKQSHLGIAVSSNMVDEITKQHAGVIISKGSLSPIMHAHTVATQSVAKIKQNLFLTLGYNVVTMVIPMVLAMVIGFAINPAVCVALMIVQSSLVLANAYAFKREELPFEPTPVGSPLNKGFAALPQTQGARLFKPVRPEERHTVPCLEGQGKRLNASRETPLEAAALRPPQGARI